MSKQYRLITRSDMDGLVCAVLLRRLGIIDDILFVHPKDMQDGKIKVSENDISTNIPYVEGIYLAFDHHLSETIRNEKKDNHIIDPEAPSAARVVYDYYGGDEKFPDFFQEMMEFVDKADSAQFSKEEILNPKGWDLLSFLMDARTGLGRFRSFRISNYNLMMDLVEYCNVHTIDEIMAHADIQERVVVYEKYDNDFKQQLKRCTTVHGNLALLDLTNEDIIYPGNRFMIYAMFYKTNISIHKIWGFKKQNMVYAIGNSIVNRTSKTSVGELCLTYGGGGHQNAGTCQIDLEKAEETEKELIAKITANG